MHGSRYLDNAALFDVGLEEGNLSDPSAMDVHDDFDLQRARELPDDFSRGIHDLQVSDVVEVAPETHAHQVGDVVVLHKQIELLRGRSTRTMQRIVWNERASE